MEAGKVKSLISIKIFNKISNLLIKQKRSKKRMGSVRSKLKRKLRFLKLKTKTMDLPLAPHQLIEAIVAL